jgi:hypothetical protein
MVTDSRANDRRKSSPRFRVIFGFGGVLAGIASLLLALDIILVIAHHKPGAIIFAAIVLFVLVAFLAVGYLGKMITGDPQWPFGRMLPGYRAWLLRVLEGKPRSRS